MNDDIFDGQILTEKLLKLNNSQQSIESLSRWCISHRKRAREVVETWDKLFNASQKEQRISFLYLANDILQNSRRKGSEFVNEFWKVLPAALRRVYGTRDQHGRKAVIRLVDIWEERKVFGSRSQGLKGEVMGKNPRPSSASNGKSSNSIKIVKKDAQSVRIKLAVGCLPEKILTAFQSVFDEHHNEEEALSKCNTAARDYSKLVEDVEKQLAQGTPLGSTLVNDLQEQEKEVKQYMDQLNNAEASRATLLSQLKDALQEQESRQELVRTQLLVAQGQIDKAASIRKQLNNAAEATLPSIQLNSTTNQPFAPLQTSEDDNRKAAAAAVVAKLAASTSSAQMLTSVFSSLVAEEAASMNGNLNSTGFTSGLPLYNPEKRPKLENPMAVSDVNGSDQGRSSLFTNLQQPSITNGPLAPSTSLQAMSPANQLQAAFGSAPQPPPHSSANPPNQYVQPTSLMVGGIPYGYGSNSLPPPPPPPLPAHMAIGFSMASTQPAQQQQQSSPGGFYGSPPGFGFYGQNHPSTPPPVPRQ
ncbi:hypothetical protein Lalb_Chr14g0365071 [Lupinus albus]|uniref:CID domain-containing protein n=1 Tax=Lupinus albus TaxID=3870 RepID=A0A6A4PBK8_LUPAL|nr:hypothetical protein Lalb_Chr14g0365071 [Lupinus albus]